MSFLRTAVKGASFFFGYIAQDIVPSETIEIVKGQRSYNGQVEHHYWIESDGNIFDLTVDQFGNSELSVCGTKTEHQQLGFQEIEREFIASYLSFYTENSLEIERFSPIKEKIVSKIVQYA